MDEGLKGIIDGKIEPKANFLVHLEHGLLHVQGSNEVEVHGGDYFELQYGIDERDATTKALTKDRISSFPYKIGQITLMKLSVLPFLPNFQELSEYTEVKKQMKGFELRRKSGHQFSGFEEITPFSREEYYLIIAYVDAYLRTRTGE